jgi:hypothetical protein
MNSSAYSAANPNRLMHFFADNIAGGGQGEFADGRVALIRLYDIELSGPQVGDLDLPPHPAIPEPRIWPLLAAGTATLGLVTRRRANRGL